MRNDLDPSLFDSKDMQSKIDSGKYYGENMEKFDFSNRLKSDKKAADYNKLIYLIGKIIDITNESRESTRQISFMSISSYKKAKDVQTPVIVYRTLGRTPRKEVKPRFRQVINDKENDNRIVNVYGQQFNMTLEFRIIDSSDELAEDTMGDLEDLMLTYTGFFMSHGVSHIRFLEQLPDTSIFDEEDFYIKTLSYLVILEKITLQSEDKMKTIIQRLSVD